MENLDFVLWVCLWPLACTLDRYLHTKIRTMTGEQEPSEEARAFMALFSIIIWIAVAQSL